MLESLQQLNDERTTKKVNEERKKLILRLIYQRDIKRGLIEQNTQRTQIIMIITFKQPKKK